MIPVVTSTIGDVRSSRTTIAKSANIAHQKAAAAASDAATLQSRLTPEKPRKNNIQKKHGRRRIEANVLGAGPMAVKATMSSSKKLSPRLSITPICGSACKTWTASRTEKRRKEKKNPMTGDSTEFDDASRLIGFAIATDPMAPDPISLLALIET